VGATVLELFKQKGTVVEKLTEETLRDKGHLLELLAVCEGVELNPSFLFSTESPKLEITYAQAAQLVHYCFDHSFVSCHSSKTDRGDRLERNEF
uniref:Uncharacterized protein n=1 Tax=Aegilops tauschii subsp. strangulata TaxID=200361 RepID=A0A453LE96_AEGTS